MKILTVDYCSRPLYTPQVNPNYVLLSANSGGVGAFTVRLISQPQVPLNIFLEVRYYRCWCCECSSAELQDSLQRM